MSMFADVKNEDGIEKAKDVLGGGNGLFDTAIYKFTIKAAYGLVSSGGAKGVAFEFKDENGRTFKNTQYVTSGTEKGCKNYYEKDGVKNYLPGYNIVNAICMMCTEKPLDQAVTENKTLKLWDSTAKAETPQNVPVLVELTGKEIYLGLFKDEVDKFGQDQTTKKWTVVTGETKEQNEIANVYHFPTKKTLNEAVEGGEAEFYDKWLAQYEGKTRERAKHKGKGGTAGRPAAASGGATPAGGSKPSSLFG